MVFFINPSNDTQVLSFLFSSTMMQPEKYLEQVGKPMMGRFAYKNGGHPNLPHFITSVAAKNGRHRKR
jgi:hypothetical protein